MLWAAIISRRKEVLQRDGARLVESGIIKGIIGLVIPVRQETNKQKVLPILSFGVASDHLNPRTTLPSSPLYNYDVGHQCGFYVSIRWC